MSSSTETFTATNNNTTPSALMLSERGGKVVEPAQSQTYTRSGNITHTFRICTVLFHGNENETKKISNKISCGQFSEYSVFCLGLCI